MTSVGAATEENNIAEILSDQGNFTGARSLFESARSTWVAARYRVGEGLATSNLGRLDARAGEVDRGRDQMERALAIFKEMNSPVFIAETELRLAECSLLAGNFAASAVEADTLLRDVRGRQGFELVEALALRTMATASALHAIADGTQATRAGWIGLLDDAIDRLAAMEATYELAVGLASRAVLDSSGDQKRAEGMFSQLGVKQVVVSWSGGPGGKPVYAFGPAVPAVCRAQGFS